MIVRSSLIVKLKERVIKGQDIAENTLTRLWFRKIPYSFWIVGFLFWLGAFASLYLIHIHAEENNGGLFVISERRHLVSYSIILFLFVMGYLFIANGRVKSTVFDKRT